MNVNVLKIMSLSPYMLTGLYITSWNRSNTSKITHWSSWKNSSKLGKRNSTMILMQSQTPLILTTITSVQFYHFWKSSELREASGVAEAPPQTILVPPSWAAEKWQGTQNKWVQLPEGLLCFRSSRSTVRLSIPMFSYLIFCGQGKSYRHHLSGLP